MTYNKTRKMIKKMGISCDLITMVDFKIVSGKKFYKKSDVISTINDEISYMIEDSQSRRT